MRNGLFKLRQFYDNAYAKLDGVVFGLRLKYLAWRYKGMDKVPLDKLPPIFVGGADEVRELINAAQVAKIVTALCKHYRLDFDSLRFTGEVGDYLHNRTASPNEMIAMHRLFNSSDLEVRIFRIMKELEDISQAKLSFFTAPAPFDSMESWLNSLKDPRREPYLRR